MSGIPTTIIRRKKPTSCFRMASSSRLARIGFRPASVDHSMATLSTDAPVTPIRPRMQQDMLMRGLGPHPQQDYVRHVRRFAALLGRAPDTATPEDVQRFQLYQHENGVGACDDQRCGFGATLPVHGDAEATRSAGALALLCLLTINCLQTLHVDDSSVVELIIS